MELAVSPTILDHGPKALLATCQLFVIVGAGSPVRPPKLAVSKTLLAQNMGDSKPFTELTYADGSKGRLELGAIQIRDVIEEIEMSNARISQLELKRGKPFP